MSIDKKLKLSSASNSSSDISEEEISLDETCGLEIGCGSCRSKRCPALFCQCFATTRWALVFLSFGAIIQGFIVNGHTPVVISTLEKRFELTSTESGLIASCYDIAGSITVVFVTYFGGRGHKPIWIGWGMFLIGLSGIVFSLPHFTAPHYVFTDVLNVCENASQELCTISALKNFRFVFYGALLLAGAGAAPLYSLSITYLDENVKQRYSSFYNGILIAMSIVGPGVGFLVGAAFLKHYTYPWESMFKEESSELWIGAWWIGSLICGIIGIAIAIPILMLPRVIPGTEEHRLNREKETHQSSKESSKDEDFGKSIVDFPKCVLILLRNPTFVFLSLGIAVDSILINGMATFGPKYMETQFGIDASDAGTYFGLIAILGGAGGQLAGGGLISKFDFTVRKMMHMSWIAPSLASFSSVGYLITCSSSLFAGVTTSYHAEQSSSINITSICNSDCGCSEGVYNPVCGSDGLTYFSPCFAGCTERDGGEYSNCSCVLGENGSFSLNASMVATATTGACVDNNCSNSWQFLVFCLCNFVLMFLTFFNGASALQVSLRCVGFNQRSFAVGVQILITRALGTIPGPLVVGSIFDKACLQWTNECGVRGSCLAYSNSTLSLYVFLLLACAKAVDVLLFLSAMFTYTPASDMDTSISLSNENDEISSISDFNRPKSGSSNVTVSEELPSEKNLSAPADDTLPNSREFQNHMFSNPVFEVEESSETKERA